MKLRSLMFRELRLSRKSIILQFGLLLAWIALTWGMLLSLNANEITGEELSVTADIINIMTALIGAMSLLLDDVFKADINSGWLTYSYTLPITPFERTAARFIRRISVSLAGAALSLCNTAAICAYTGKNFGANHIVWHMVIFSAMILFSLPNNIIMLRVRSQSEMKKAHTSAGLAFTGLIIVMTFAIFIVSDVDLAKLAESDSLFQLPVFTFEAFVWSVPLLIAMTAASFFTAYHSFKLAYHTAAKSEKETAEITQTALPTKTDGATGLLYKELKQNRTVFILAVLVPILLTAFPFCFAIIKFISNSTDANGLFEAATNVIIRMLMCVCGIFAVSGLMSELFKGDDKKLWAYFIVSTPQGVKGFLYCKYVITIMMNLLYMISGIFADHLLATLNYFVTGEELTSSMQSFYISGVFILMAISAFDIPFTVRYGSKKGSIVKMIVMLLLCAAGVAVFSLLPDDIRKSIVELALSAFNGNANDALAVILSLLPYIALAMFLFSYKISCKVFMKGVNEYDK